MHMKKLICSIVALGFLTLVAAAPPPKWMKAKLSDLGIPTYADRFPTAASFSQPLRTPRGNQVSFKLNMLAPINVEVRFKVQPFQQYGEKLQASVTAAIQPLIPVHVEGNTQWPVQNYPGGQPQEGWKSYFIRQAPFDLFEVVDSQVVQGGTLKAGAPVTYLVTLTIPVETEKGLYRSHLVISSPGKQAIWLPITLDVSSVRKPDEYALDSNHWLFPEPVNLTNGPVPEYWSEEHWKLLEQTGRTLLACGDNMIYTPIIFAEKPLIQTVKSRTGTYTFDFAGFRRWIRTFKALGFKYFAGTHMASWMLPLYVLDEDTGKRRKIPLKDKEFLEVIKEFMPCLHHELKALDILDSYRQYQQDEPRAKDLENYRRIAAIRKRYLPTVKSIDAVLDIKNDYADLVDIQVLNLPRAYMLRERVKATPTRYWLYCCTSPYPPFPNRHLDRMPIENRIWPLLAVNMNTVGFLNWAANVYRGADEYKTSLGPLPDGAQNPGHPPGDCWLFYRSPKGLVPGIRMLNYRDGLLDATLYAMLVKNNPEKAKRLVTRVIFPDMLEVYRRNMSWIHAADMVGKTYATDPAQYNILRSELLQALEKEQKHD